ncbi:MAG TPA: hypothetical protein VMH02_12615 [Verrucomicrobiae bacterium]|nr:hypothetical protein [Verrucomicrobiae bacterium]
MPTAIRAVTQPVLERFANDLQQAFAQENSIAVVTMRRDAKAVVDLQTCKQLGLSGYLEPWRRWRVASSDVTVTAGLVILDCYGNLFYDGSSTKIAARDESVTPQIQVDAAGASATSDLLRKFAAFKAVHQSTWDMLAATGSIVEPTLSTP